MSLRRTPSALALLVSTWSTLAGCAHATPHRRALLPSEALALAGTYSADGDEACALQVLTQALCQSSKKAAPNQAQLASQMRLLGAWVRAWDYGGREPGPRQQVVTCLADAPLAPLAAMMLADATGGWDEVIAIGERALAGARPPLRGELALRHAIATMHQGRTGRAVALLVEAIAETPDHPDLYVALAQAREALGLYDGVKPALLPLLRLGDVVPPDVLARARGILNAAREAAAPPLTAADLAEQVDLTTVAAARELHPEDVAHVRTVAAGTQQPRLLTLCALVLLRAGDVVTGRALLHRAAEALPMDPEPSRLLAAHYLTVSDWDGALAALAEAVRRNPFDVETQGLLATVAARTGAHAVAARAYDALVRLEPAAQAHYDGLQRSLTAAKIAPPLARP